MNGRYINILLSAVALLMTVACKKEHRPEEETPVSYIMLSATEAGSDNSLNKGTFNPTPGTKAMLDADMFATSGNQIRVYDYYTPATGAAYYYIDGDLAQSNGSSWPFQNKHEWTQDGTHKFFGWLVKDNSNTSSPLTAENFFGQGFGLNNNKELIIPSTTIENGSNAFDFMYSNISTRDLNGDVKDFSPVPMDFNHLYTSFSISAYEVAKFNDYKIDYIEFNGLTTTNSAVIDYSGDQPIVTYGIASGATPYRINHAVTLSADPIDLISGSVIESAEQRQYLLAWPQAARSTTLTIGYQVKDVSKDGTEFQPFTKTITLPYAWDAGKKNNLNLELKDKEIKLTYEVEPWNVKDEEIDFSDQVTVDATIEWVRSTVQDVDYTTGEVILFDDKNIEATGIFTILTPKGATWTASLISKEGHPDAFRFVEGTKYGVVGRPDTLKLAVTNLDPVSPRHVCQLLITVQTADGRTIVVDDILTPEKDEEDNETDYDRFTIIQNFIN